MRFATRIFVSSFVPFALLLAVSFWAIRASVITTVRNSLRASAWDNAVALNREQARNQARDRKWLQGVAENPTLKASVQLLATERSGAVPDQKHNTVEDQSRNTLLDLQYNTVQDEARLAVQGQLSQICDSLAFDFIMISGVHGEPLAAVLRDTGGFTSVNFHQLKPPEQGFVSADNRIYEVTSVPVREAGMQVATLTVGALFDISRFGVPAVLLHNG